MIEKGKISVLQLALLILPLIISTAILSIAKVTGEHAHRDMWISPIFSSLNGFFTAFIVYRLHKMFPEETFIQYIQRIAGRYLGKTLGFVYLFYFMYVSSLIIREYADFVVASFLPKTPMIVVTGSMILVCTFAVRSGIEVLARATQIFVAIYLLTIPLLLLLLPELDLKTMFPIMEHGILPVLRGAIQPSLWFGQIFVASMLYPYLSNQKGGMRWSLLLVSFCLVIMVFINFVCLYLFGDSITSFAYPLFYAFRYISIATFFEHLEAIVIVVWVMGVFIKLSVFYYVLVLGSAQWLQLSDYRSLVFPFGFLICLFGFWVSPSVPELFKFIETIIPFIESSLFTFIPLMLVGIALIRKKIKKTP